MIARFDAVSGGVTPAKHLARSPRIGVFEAPAEPEDECQWCQIPKAAIPGTQELKAQVTAAWEEAQEVHRQEPDQLFDFAVLPMTACTRRC